MQLKFLWKWISIVAIGWAQAAGFDINFLPLSLQVSAIHLNHNDRKMQESRVEIHLFGI